MKAFFLRAFILVTIAFALLAPNAALAAKRLALIIGNDSYQTLPKLQRAKADATSIAEALRQSGFEVIIEYDVTRREFNRKISNLEARIQPGDTVFFFFAGHGVAIGPENVLLPVDMPVPATGEESLVREEGILTDAVVQRITARGAATTLLVLDACRDNPFESTGTRGIGRSRGLARTDAPRSVFVLYSAGIGQTALDSLSDSDDGKNSVFTRNLLPLLVKPGLTHVELAKRVQTDTDKLAASVGHQQQPAYYDQIVGDFVLNPKVEEPPPPPAPPPEPSEEDKKKARLAEAAAAWATLETTVELPRLEAFLLTYGDTAFAKLAKDRLAALQPPAPAPPPIVKPLPEEPPVVPPEPVVTPQPEENPPPVEDAAPVVAPEKKELEARAEPPTVTPDPPAAKAIPLVTPKADAPKTTPVKKRVSPPAVKKPPVKKTVTRTKRVKKAPVRKPAVSQRRSGRNCFTFEGQRVCD